MASLSPSALRDRLDRLRGDASEAPGLWERLTHRADAPLPDTPELLKLDEELAHAGVHTLADARLLGRLARADARSGQLAQGLRRRLERAVRELVELVEALERHKRLSGKVGATAVARAEDRVARLERVWAIERALAAPEQRDPARETTPLKRPARRRAPPSSAGLAAIERYLDRAGGETTDLRRKRRDLDRAHELLLGIASNLGSSDRERAQGLRARLADERHRLGALEELVRPGEPVQQAIVRALHEGKTEAAYRGLLAVYRGALQSEAAPLAAASRAALEALWSGLAEPVHQALGAEASRQLEERLGDGALRSLLRKVQNAESDALLETTYGLKPERFALFNLALSAGEFFDVSATEEEVEEGEPLASPGDDPLRRVPFPTPQMDFDIARGIHELRDFVINDPRTVLFDLASGRQLVRAYYEERVQKPRKTRRSAVRVYVCDASGSMRGARARFRDAILIAELNNLSLRARAGREVWPIYFTFFNDQPTPLRRIDSASAAHDAIADLFERSPARGRTDITFALESAFSAIHEAKGRDPDLARATVVLITDGEDQVDASRISAARAPVGDVELTLNFISLGDENPDLRGLVDAQRSSGRRAFYTHLTDADLEVGAHPFQPQLRTLLPEFAEIRLTPDHPAIRAALDALAAIALGAPAPEGPPASIRFDTYFPAAPLAPPVTPPARDELERVADLLGAVGEALALAPSAERADEAVELLEHVLGLYAVPLERYRAVLGAPKNGLEPALRRIRLLSGRPATTTSATGAPSALEAADGH